MMLFLFFEKKISYCAVVLKKVYFCSSKQNV